MKRKMRLGWILSYALVIVLVTASFAFAKAEYKIVYGQGLEEDSAQFKAMEYFKELVETNSDGRIEVELYAGGQLGHDRKMMEALQLGIQEMTGPSTAVVTPFINDFKVFDLPFLFPNAQCAYAVLDGPVGQRILDKLETIGIKGLVYFENGYRNVTNNVRPIRIPEDVKGLKIRTMESPMHLAAWRQLGANPTPMAFGEVFSALQQGVIDGQENPWAQILLSHLYEVQKYATDTGHVYSPLIQMVSLKFWNSLPEDLQDVMMEAAVKARDRDRQLNAELGEKFLSELKTKMEITTLTSDERKAFQEAVQPMYEQVADEIGPALIEEVQTAVTEFQAANAQ